MKNPYYTKKHMVLEILAYVFMAASFVVALIGVLVLPEKIPTHFDFAGNIDGYGSKATLFLLPGSCLFTQVIMSFSIHLIRPEKWNMPFDVKLSRRHLVYGDVNMMTVLLCLLMGIYSLAGEWTWYFRSGVGLLGMTALLVVGIFAVIIVMMIQMFRHNR